MDRQEPYTDYELAQMRSNEDLYYELMKTQKEYLELLEEPYRTKALEQMKYPLAICSSISDALMGAFIWKDSYEGADYWEELHDKLIKTKQ